MNTNIANNKESTINKLYSNVNTRNAEQLANSNEIVKNSAPKALEVNDFTAIKELVATPEEKLPGYVPVIKVNSNSLSTEMVINKSLQDKFAQISDKLIQANENNQNILILEDIIKSATDNCELNITSIKALRKFVSNEMDNIARAHRIPTEVQAKFTKIINDFITETCSSDDQSHLGDNDNSGEPVSNSGVGGFNFPDDYGYGSSPWVNQIVVILLHLIDVVFPEQLKSVMQMQEASLKLTKMNVNLAQTAATLGLDLANDAKTQAYSGADATLWGAIINASASLGQAYTDWYASKSETESDTKLEEIKNNSANQSEAGQEMKNYLDNAGVNGSPLEKLLPTDEETQKANQTVQDEKKAITEKEDKREKLEKQIQEAGRKISEDYSEEDVKEYHKLLGEYSNLSSDKYKELLPKLKEQENNWKDVAVKKIGELRGTDLENAYFELEPKVVCNALYDQDGHDLEGEAYDFKLDNSIKTANDLTVLLRPQDIENKISYHENNIRDLTQEYTARNADIEACRRNIEEINQNHIGLQENLQANLDERTKLSTEHDMALKKEVELGSKEDAEQNLQDLEKNLKDTKEQLHSYEEQYRELHYIENNNSKPSKVSEQELEDMMSSESDDEYSVDDYGKINTKDVNNEIVKCKALISDIEQAKIPAVKQQIQMIEANNQLLERLPNDIEDVNINITMINCEITSNRDDYSKVNQELADLNIAQSKTYANMQREHYDKMQLQKQQAVREALDFMKPKAELFDEFNGTIYFIDREPGNRFVVKAKQGQADATTLCELSFVDEQKREAYNTLYNERLNDPIYVGKNNEFMKLLNQEANTRQINKSQARYKEIDKALKSLGWDGTTIKKLFAQGEGDKSNEYSAIIQDAEGNLVLRNQEKDLLTLGHINDEFEMRDGTLVPTELVQAFNQKMDDDIYLAENADLIRVAYANDTPEMLVFRQEYDQKTKEITTLKTQINSITEKNNAIDKELQNKGLSTKQRKPLLEEKEENEEILVSLNQELLQKQQDLETLKVNNAAEWNRFNTSISPFEEKIANGKKILDYMEACKRPDGTYGISFSQKAQDGKGETYGFTHITHDDKLMLRVVKVKIETIKNPDGTSTITRTIESEKDVELNNPELKAQTKEAWENNFALMQNADVLMQYYKDVKSRGGMIYQTTRDMLNKIDEAAVEYSWAYQCKEMANSYSTIVRKLQKEDGTITLRQKRATARRMARQEVARALGRIGFSAGQYGYASFTSNGQKYQADSQFNATLARLAGEVIMNQIQSGDKAVNQMDQLEMGILQAGAEVLRQAYQVMQTASSSR